MVLSSSSNAQAELNSIKENLKTWTYRLDHLAGEFSSIRREQSDLKNSEEQLEAKEATIRSAVHAARDSVMSLRYKIHDMESDALSNAMFGGATRKATKHSPSATHKTAAMQHFSATVAVSGAKQAIQPHLSSPTKLGEATQKHAEVSDAHKVGAVLSKTVESRPPSPVAVISAAKYDSQPAHSKPPSAAALFHRAEAHKAAQPARVPQHSAISERRQSAIAALEAKARHALLTAIPAQAPTSAAHAAPAVRAPAVRAPAVRTPAVRPRPVPAGASHVIEGPLRIALARALAVRPRTVAGPAPSKDVRRKAQRVQLVRKPLPARSRPAAHRLLAVTYTLRARTLPGALPRDSPLFGLPSPPPCPLYPPPPPSRSQREPRHQTKAADGGRRRQARARAEDIRRLTAEEEVPFAPFTPGSVTPPPPPPHPPCHQPGQGRLGPQPPLRRFPFRAFSLSPLFPPSWYGCTRVTGGSEPGAVAAPPLRSPFPTSEFIRRHTTSAPLAPPPPRCLALAASPG